MSSVWSSNIFVFADEGQDHVSINPPAVHKAHTRVFLAKGPQCPIDVQGPQKVGNATEWMARLNRQGFSFVLVDSEP
jgi:hypothetical protein